VLYLKYTAGLLFITLLGGAFGVWLMPRSGLAALAGFVAAIEMIVFSGLTSARVLLGMAMARFAAASVVEPVLLPLLGRAVDFNDKAAGIAAEIAAEFKLRAGSITGRIPVLGPVLNFLIRRVPAYLIERNLAPRIRELAQWTGGAPGAPGDALEQPTRDERAHALLGMLRERLRTRAREGVRFLLKTYAALAALQVLALFLYLRFG
jgi:hypothetical protein